jgi:hypothetical protein
MHFGCPSNLGEKLKISYLQLVVELGLTEQPFQESFSTCKDMVTGDLELACLFLGKV